MRPPFTITPTVLGHVEELSRLLGRFEGLAAHSPQPSLRKENRIRTIQASVAIEGNTLSVEQVTALLEGKRVAGSAKEIREVHNALAAYELAPKLQPWAERDLLRAHRTMMEGLVEEPGRYRSRNVGVMKGTQVAHVAPPARQVPRLMAELLEFVRKDVELPLLIRACVCHYELEFIHPFMDGNGRVGRLWQHVALLRQSPVFGHVPVESLIRERQSGYYEALSRSDKAGHCTPFLEFSLKALRDGLAELLDALRPEVDTADKRLSRASEHFGRGWFTRRDYLALHKVLSLPTCSRDLRMGFDQRLLERRGEKALTEYRFQS